MTIARLIHEFEHRLIHTHWFETLVWAFLDSNISNVYVCITWFTNQFEHCLILTHWFETLVWAFLDSNIANIYVCIAWFTYQFEHRLIHTHWFETLVWAFLDSNISNVCVCIAWFTYSFEHCSIHTSKKCAYLEIKRSNFIHHALDARFVLPCLGLGSDLLMCIIACVYLRAYTIYIYIYI